MDHIITFNAAETTLRLIVRKTFIFSKITRLPRTPQERNSREFLWCHDLGIIHSPKYLPDDTYRRYYDGCLILDVHEIRTTIKQELESSVILHPDMHCMYYDIGYVTSDCDAEVQTYVEQTVLEITSRPSLSNTFHFSRFYGHRVSLLL